MRANEFVKKFGWGEAISLIDASKICGIDKSVVENAKLIYKAVIGLSE